MYARVPAPTVAVSSFINLSTGVLARRHVDILDDDVFKLGFNGRRFVKRWVRRIIHYCRDLSLPRHVCFEATRVFMRLVESSPKMLQHDQALKLAGVSILKAAWDLKMPLSVARVEDKLGVRLLSTLSVLGFKQDYSVEAEYAFARVASIVSRQVDSVELVRKAREVYEKILSGTFEDRALAAFYYASRLLRLAFNITAVCRQLGRNPDSCGNSARTLARRYLRVS
jgi:hypothetical protein